MKKAGVGSKIFIVLILLFLYVPLIVLMIMSFNVSRYNSLPFEFTTKWYIDLFKDDTLLIAARTTVILAFITGIICMILATLFVLGQRFLKKRTDNLFNSIVMMPMSIPWIIMGLSMLLMIRTMGMTKNLFFVAAGHVVISLPYSMLVLRARMSSMDKSLEEMSASLGASAKTTFLRITLPAIGPAIVAGGFLSFMISFDNFAISYFLMPSGTSTLPIEIQSSIKFGFTPEINALSTIIIGISLGCLVIVGIIMKSNLKSILSTKE